MNKLKFLFKKLKKIGIKNWIKNKIAFLKILFYLNESLNIIREEKIGEKTWMIFK